MAELPKKQLYNSKGEAFFPNINESDPVVSDRVDQLWAKIFPLELNVAANWSKTQEYKGTAVTAQGRVYGTDGPNDINISDVTSLQINVGGTGFVDVTNKANFGKNAAVSIQTSSGTVTTTEPKTFTLKATYKGKDYTATAAAPAFYDPSYYGWVSADVINVSNGTNNTQLSTYLANIVGGSTTNGVFTKFLKANNSTTDVTTTGISYTLGGICVLTPSESNATKVTKVQEGQMTPMNYDQFNIGTIVVNSISYNYLIAKVPATMPSTIYKFSFGTR